MFTGLIEEIGVIKKITRFRDALELTISCSEVLQGCKLGDSIAINGVCQTVTSFDKSTFTVDTLQESLTKSNLGRLKVGSSVNLERALTMGKPLGGHFVTGHVQGLSRVSSIIKSSNNIYLKLDMSRELLGYMVKEGSITVDGVSLTISNVKGQTVELNIIPHTFRETIIKSYRVGDMVNIEPDILIKAVNKSEGLTMEKLQSWGY